MMRRATLRDLRHEYLGKELKVLDSPNKTEINLQGLIWNETKNSFVLLVKKGLHWNKKVILKKGRTFQIGNVVIKGDWILKRPEERVMIKHLPKGGWNGC